MIKLKNILSEGKYYVTYNKGGGKGKGLMGGEFKTYKDAAKYAKDAASPSSMTAYWVSDKNMNRLTEGVPMPMDTPNEFAYLEFKKWAYKKRGKIKKQMLSLKDDGGKMFRAMELVWQTWAKSTNNKAYTKVKNPSKFGRALIVMMWKDNLIFNKNTNKITRLKETIDLRKIFMKGRKKKRTTDEGKITERLAKGLKPLLKLGSTITKKVGEAALIKLSDKFDRIDDEYAGEIASWLDMAIELMQDGYAGDATKKLKQFNKKCKDVLKGKSIKSAFAEGKLNEGKISVADESRFGKFLSIKLTDGKSFRVAIFKSQSLANKYNRNKQADIDKLWDLAKKYTGAVIKEAEYGTPTGTKTLKSIDAKFDDAVFKVPPHKITRDWVLKIAKKYKVDPKKAIEWVNLNPKINIKEGKSIKVKDKVNERLNSQKLRSLLAVLNNELIEMPWVKTDSGTLQKTLEKAIMKAVKEKTLSEGKLNEATAKQMLQHAVNALTKTIPGRKLDKNYVKKYLKSIEQIARRKPQDFVKDYGKFKFADWIEDVEYNMQNEGKISTKRLSEIIIEEYKKLLARK